MSIIIKGIDMPKEDQVIVIHSDGAFNLVDPTARVLMSLYEAIQIPKDHGRLIDGDELLQRIVSLPSFRTNFEGVPWAVLKDVEVLPEVRHSKAILEAEAES